MFSMGRMPSAGSVFSSYTAFAAAVMVVRSVLQELQSLIRQYIPPPIREKIFNFFANLINLSSDPQNTMTLTIQRFAGVSLNELFAGAETYLGTIITPSNTNLIASKTPREAHISLSINRSGDTIVDHFDGVNLVWSLTAAAAGNGRPSSSYSYPEDDCLDGGGGGRSRPRPTTSTSTSLEKRAIELKFDKRFKEKVVTFYLPHVMERARAIIAARKRVRLFSLGSFGDMGPGSRGMWNSVDFDHPSTFETVAMEEEMKKMVVDDLDMFVKRKDFYKRIGKAWKRGYLLYGPPGTGKSSLIAAMANHLRFDVYDLQLKSMESLSCDWDLRRLLVSVPNKSILVIEDVDCSTTTIDLENRAIDDPKPVNTKIKRKRFTLSELLNFTDGLWSSCGDERIIVFTTNNKDKLDPALLRPGRMDMHIHMSYLRPGGFKTLAFNYLMIKDHRLFGEIEEMLKEVDTTPAEAAENLLRSDDADVALEGLVEFLRNKKKEMSIKSVEVVSTCTDHVDEQNNGCDGNKQDMEDEDSSEDDQHEEWL